MSYFLALPIHAEGTNEDIDEVATKQTNGGTTSGYESELWAMADALRGSMDAVECQHAVLGLIFLRYISDAFEERRAVVLAKRDAKAAEDRDENIFWVPPEARWMPPKATRRPNVGRTLRKAVA